MQLYAINKASAGAGVTQVVPQMLGRPARRFNEFARDHAAAWRLRYSRLGVAACTC